jgi:GNAT superfamily N-acetyltransferase
VPILGAILAETRRDDGYPPHWPAAGQFLIATPDELDSFVYEESTGRPIGHVALHERSARPVMEVAMSATGLAVNRLAVVARLFVRGTARRTGAGRALLERATVRAHELGRRPILDVWDSLGDARALYESAGWQMAGSARLEFRSGCTADCVHAGSSIDSFVFLGPSA